MIDLKNAPVYRLKPVDGKAYLSLIQDLVLPDEFVMYTYQSAQGGAVITNLRLILIEESVGGRREIVSLPYKKLLSFSIAASGRTLDADSQLELHFSKLGTVKLDFPGPNDMIDICKTIEKKLLL